MAELKKPAAVPVVKEAEKKEVTAKAADPEKTTPKTAAEPVIKVEVNKEEPVKPAAKAPAKKADKAAEKVPAKKTAAKKATTVKAAATKTTAAKTTAAQKTEAKPKAKKSAKQIINLQFSGKSYTMEDIVKIASDVWKFDLHKSDEAYTSLELYVKPEESVAYYVFNGEITGSFFI